MFSKKSTVAGRGEIDQAGSEGIARRFEEGSEGSDCLFPISGRGEEDGAKGGSQDSPVLLGGLGECGMDWQRRRDGRMQNEGVHRHSSFRN